MVDSINGNYGVTSQDTSINWNDLTATEILEYEDEGQEVPDAILAWAQDMSKTEYADDVTYEMASGETDISSDQEISPADAGSTLQRQLDEDNKTLPEQAVIFAQESELQVNTIQALEDEMENILQESEAAASSVQEYTNDILGQIETLNARKEALQNDQSTMFGALQGAQLDAQIRQLGELGLANIDSQSEVVYSATNGIDEALNAAIDTTSIGNTSIDIGNSLIETESNSRFTEYFNAVRAIRNGTNAINAATEGTATFNETEENNVPFEDQVNTNRNSVTSASGASGITETENTDTEAETEENAAATEDNTGSANETETTAEQSVTDKFEQDRTAAQEEAEIDPTLADTSITTDPDEILRRKERRGLT